MTIQSFGDSSLDQSHDVTVNNTCGSPTDDFMMNIHHGNPSPFSHKRTLYSSSAKVCTYMYIYTHIRAFTTCGFLYMFIKCQVLCLKHKQYSVLFQTAGKIFPKHKINHFTNVPSIITQGHLYFSKTEF